MTMQERAVGLSTLVYLRSAEGVSRNLLELGTRTKLCVDDLPRPSRPDFPQGQAAPTKNKTNPDSYRVVQRSGS